MSLVGNFAFNNYDRQAEVAGIGGGTAFTRKRSQEDAPPPPLERNESWKTADEDANKEIAVDGEKSTSRSRSKSSAERDSEKEAEADDKIHNLARTITGKSGKSTWSQVPGNPFEGEPDSEIDPHSANFKPRTWVKSLLKLRSRDPEKFPERTAGIACRNLSVHGYGSGTDYQKNVGNIWLQAVGMVRQLLGVGQTRIDILRNFDFLVKAGEMLVVLGPPGSGCTTLLKSISGETHGFVIDEGSHLNYQGISAKMMHKNFRGEAIYTAETDVHFPMLTVGDTLEFAARARAPRHIPGGVDKNTFAKHLRDVIMAIFGISHTVNTKVGNDFVRGVSGGERKRVSIAEAALSGAPLQCWDNSTRGLDSANAIEFCKTLRLETDLLGATACVSIYQSPQSAYDFFDKVIVLYEGRQIFFGRTDEARGYFERLGFHCPDRQTDADFCTSMTSPQEREVRSGFEDRAPRTPDDFASAWKSSPEYERLIKEIEDYDNTYKIGGEYFEKFKQSRRMQQAKQQRWRSPFTLSYKQQVDLCLWRGFLRLKADPSLTFFQLFANFLMALVIGSVFYNLQSDTASFYYRGSLLFFAILLNAFGSALEILTLYAQRPIVEKHSQYALYHASTEAVASMLTDMPYKICNAIIFNTTLYFMANLRREPGPYFFFLLTSFTLTLTMSMFFRLIASVSRTLSQAMAPAAILILALVIYTGFVIPTRYMLGWSRWINYLDPIAYGFESLMINEFHNREFTCSSFIPAGPSYTNIGATNHICTTVGSTTGSNVVFGDNYINSSFQYYHAHKWRNYGIVWVFMIGLCAFYLLATEFISAKKSKGEVLVFRRGHAPAALKHAKNDEEAAANVDAAAIAEKNLDRDISAVIQEQTAIFHWKDVCYDIQIKGEPRRILDHIDGWVKPGTLTALMGVSGAGKTTLLDALATRTTIGVVQGEMLVDGRHRDSSFQRKTGYVQQQDLHLSTSTVREALNFSALLRQPAHIPRQEKLDYVNEVIKLLDMKDYADAVVGVPGEGLNVEQRKRLTIGVELAAKPELLLFLDEPTSGLDSQTSWAICDLMEKLTKSGQAILCTIHQPSAMLFQRFDRLLFLASGGKTVYFGEIGKNSSTLIDYFEKNGSFPCPSDANPAEWMLEVIGAAPGTHSDINWPDVWRNSPEIKAVHAHLDELKANRPHEAPPRTTSDDKESYREFAARFPLQLYEVCKRVFEQYWRTPSYIYSKTALCVFSGLFIGFSFFHAQNSQQGLQNQMFSLFMLMTIFGQLVQQITPHFVTQRALYEARERPAKTYSWKAFMISNIIVEIPWNTLMAVLIFFCWYYPIGLYRNAEATDAVHERGGLMFLYIWTFLLFTCTFADLAVAGIPDAESAGNLANLAFSLCLIFCGVLAPPSSLPGFWIFMYRVSPFTYLISGMLSTAVANTNVVCADNELLAFTPPSGQTCGDYMQSFISTAGGYLQNNDTMAPGQCSFCPESDTNIFLAGVSSFYSQRWRNWGLMWAFITFNVVVAVLIYWLARVPKRVGWWRFWVKEKMD
ncbi:MAG: hypothetical protein M1820_004258 [Bogoriella megaspora]|nr:MAG: hypothetical protein M1820_004258 [Bogoriella megaspora]